MKLEAKILLTAILLLGSLALPAKGQEASLTQKLSAEAAVWVGQRARLSIELCAPGIFSGVPFFDLPRVSGVLLLKVDERPVIGSKEIGGVSYTTQLHEIALFARRAGRHEIPAFPIRLESGPVGADAEARMVNTEAFVLEARMPPGAEGRPGLISTTGLEVTQSWEPEPKEVIVGSAFTRKITMRAPDVPGMALPPLPLPEIPGLGSYPRSPEVIDRNDRGELTGERTEIVTWVCERPGTHVLPAMVITWWDLEDEKLRRETLPAVNFVVTGNVGAGRRDSASRENVGARWWWLLLVPVAGAGAFAAIRRRRPAGPTEPSRFAEVREAAEAGNARATVNALYRWLEAAHSSRSLTLESALGTEDEKLSGELRKLLHACVDPTQQWAGRDLLEGLGRHRASTAKRSSHSALPQLNPESQ